MASRYSLFKKFENKEYISLTDHQIVIISITGILTRQKPILYVVGKKKEGEDQ